MISSISETTQTTSDLVSAADSTLGKEDFMQLLVAQLQQQDPLNPQDGAEFVAQLAQFSSVEQLMNIGTGMDTLALAQQAATSAQVVGFIGRDAVSLADVSNGAVSLSDPPTASFTLNEDTKGVTIEVLDSSGNTVRTIEAGDLESGKQSIEFDGRDDDGQLLDTEADYSIRVMGRDRVVGVTYESGYPELLLDGGSKVTMSEIVRVEDGTSSSTSGGTTVTADDILPASAVATATSGQTTPLSQMPVAGASLPSTTPAAVSDEPVEPALSDYIQRVLDQF